MFILLFNTAKAALIALLFVAMFSLWWRVHPLLVFGWIAFVLWYVWPKPRK